MSCPHTHTDRNLCCLSRCRCLCFTSELCLSLFSSSCISWLSGCRCLPPPPPAPPPPPVPPTAPPPLDSVSGTIRKAQNLLKQYSQHGLDGKKGGSNLTPLEGKHTLVSSPLVMFTTSGATGSSVLTTSFHNKLQLIPSVEIFIQEQFTQIIPTLLEKIVEHPLWVEKGILGNVEYKNLLNKHSFYSCINLNLTLKHKYFML